QDVRHVKHDLQALRELAESRQSRRHTWKQVAVASVLVAFIALVFLGSSSLRRSFLGQPSTGAAQAIKSLAILPLQNFTGDPSQEYLVDGMTDALITNLSKLSSLRVISRTSAMHYKGTHLPLSAIARELNVNAVVEGAVSRDGNHL